MVHVDITTICNYRCIHCPQGDPEKWTNNKPVMMKEDHFYKVVDETSAHGAILRITTDGEPLLHPKIKEFLSYALNSNIYAVTLTTNGSLFDEEITKLVAQPSKVKLAVDFSVDAFFRESYEKIRQSGKYVLVLRNIFGLIEARNRLRANHLYVMVNAIDQEESRGEIELFKSFWSEITDRVIIRKYLDVKGLVGGLSGPMSSPPPERWPCVLLWSRIMITPEGEIRFCIDDWNNETVFPEITIDNTSIAEVWKCPKYEKLRKAHLDGSYGHKACVTCRNWEGLRWDYDYSVALASLFSDGQNWSGRGISKYRSEC